MPNFELKDPEFERRVRESFSQQALMRTIGAALTRVSEGEVEIELPFRSTLTQQHGYTKARSRKSQGATSGEVKRAIKTKGYKENEAMQALTFLIDRSWVTEEKETRQVTVGRGPITVEMVRYRITDRGIEHFEGQSKFASGQSERISITIEQSTIAALNLGEIICNIQAVVTNLRDAGSGELAQLLKDIIEKVAGTEELGDQRRDIIESLTEIGEQATLPENQRRPGVVKSLVKSVGEAIGQIASLAQIWGAVAPIAGRYFGLQ